MVFVFVALSAYSEYRATATTITTNNLQVQPGVRWHSSNHQTACNNSTHFQGKAVCYNISYVLTLGIILSNLKPPQVYWILEVFFWFCVYFQVDLVHFYNKSSSFDIQSGIKIRLLVNKTVQGRYTLSRSLDSNSKKHKGNL